MGCGAAEATGLGFVCFVVINPRAQPIGFGFFFFVKYISFLLPSPPQVKLADLAETIGKFGLIAAILIIIVLVCKFVIIKLEGGGVGGG